MRLLARLAGVAVALALLAALVVVFRPGSRAGQAALLVLSIAVGGVASERLLRWIGRR